MRKGPESKRDFLTLPPPEYRGKRSVWADITRDAKTGHTVAKDYFKAVSFFGGLLYLIVLTPAVALLTKEHVLLPEGPGITMMLLAFGLVGFKILDNYLNRATADNSGNPLVQPGTAEAPANPKPMLPDGQS